MTNFYIKSMASVTRLTDNQQIIDHAAWALERYSEEQWDYLDGFYSEWIYTNVMPDIEEYMLDN